VKKEIRKRVRLALAAIPPDEQARKSQAACESLLALPEYRDAEAVMAYMPLGGELDCTAVLKAALDAGKIVLVPRVLWHPHGLLVMRLHSLADRMEESSYGIREPVDGEPWPVNRIDFIVVPAMAFDRTGRRLGKGGGFYDRFLASAGLEAVTCGLAFDEQVLEFVPTDEHDRNVNMLVTDKEIFRFANP